MLDDVSGIIPVYKPRGVNSTDISRIIKRRFGKLKMGHAGTLDPMAEGVLPILLGEATKLQDYVIQHPKTYQFRIKLGVSTDTLDKDGTPTKSGPTHHLSNDLFSAALKEFTGTIEQVPPLYSAVKLDGERLYQRAYSDNPLPLDSQEIERLKRKVFVYRLAIIEPLRQEEILLEATVSKGTYIRTLAQDLCHFLKTEGHLIFLKRSEACGISADDCISIEALTTPESEIQKHLIPINSVSIGLPCFRPDDKVRLRKLTLGQTVDYTPVEFQSWLSLKAASHDRPSKTPEEVSVYDDEKLIGIARTQTSVDWINLKLKRGIR